MHPSIRAALIALVLALAPLSALAQVTETSTPVSPAPGVVLFHDWPQDYISKFWTVFSNDVAPYASQLSTWATPLPNTLWHYAFSTGDNEHFNFLFDGGSTPNPRTDLSHSTLNRACALIDPTAVGTADSYNGDWQGSASEANANRVFVYTPTAVVTNGGTLPAGWSDRSQKHSGCPPNDSSDYFCHYGVARFSCASYALPGQTLAASSYNITPGQSVKLNWTDPAYRDRIGEYYSAHTGYASNNGKCPGEPRPINTSCSATGFTLSGKGYSWTGPGKWDAETGACSYDEAQTFSAFSPDPISSVTVSPTTTTTYSFTCTNANGTRTVSATVNVGSAGKPDLTAGSVSPTAAAVGSATKFSATVKNQGTAPTGGSFPVLYQKATSATGANAANIGTDSSAPALAAGASETSTMDTGAALTEGTWYVRACANTTNNSTFSVSESDTANNCGEWTMVTVVTAASAKPDLTASSTSPSSANVGQATTLSATIANGGATGTSAGFPDLFEISQVNNPSLFSQIYATKSYASAALAAGGSNIASASYTFPSAGTWYVRACANTDTSGNTPASSYTGTPESNYTNNCGSSWTTVTVTNATCTNGAINPTACTQCPNNLAYIGGSCVACSNGGCTGGGGSSGNPTGGLSCNNGATNPASCNAFPPSCSVLDTNPTDINTGDKVSLKWSCANASSCAQIANSDGFSTGNKVSGTDNSVKPSVPSGQVTYGLTCGGTNFYFPPVTVHSPKATLSASATRVPAGSTVTLHGIGTDVKSCSITNDTQGSTVIADSKAASGSWDKTSTAQTIAGQTAYTLSCKTNGASVTDSLIVNVLPGFKEF